MLFFLIVFWDTGHDVICLETVQKYGPRLNFYITFGLGMRFQTLHGSEVLRKLDSLSWSTQARTGSCSNDCYFVHWKHFDMLLNARKKCIANVL